MTGYINALIQDNENKTVWIGQLMNSAKEQALILQQHQFGQEVLAGVIKGMMSYQQNQQAPQPQVLRGPGPVVTEIDDDSGTGLDFRGGPNPHTTPPDIGSLSIEIVLPILPNNWQAGQRF